MPRDYNFIVGSEEAGKRIDLFLSGKSEIGHSRTFIQRLISEKKVLLNNLAVEPAHKVAGGDRVSVSVSEDKPLAIAPEKINLKVIYEDEDILVIDKPQGLVVHPAPGNTSGTLVNALLSYTDKLSSVNPQRPGIVHRLDKETSGLMVIAKNNLSHLDLLRQFAQHTVRKKYIAFVKGKVEFDEEIIDLPIGQDEKDFRRRAVRFRNSRYAVTRYKVIKRCNGFTLLELIPETGRTHQLRVHLASLGHPILGDTKYARLRAPGKIAFGRLALHASELGFRHPKSGKRLDFKSELPAEFTNFILAENKK